MTTQIEPVVQRWGFFLAPIIKRPTSSHWWFVHKWSGKYSCVCPQNKSHARQPSHFIYSPRWPSESSTKRLWFALIVHEKNIDLNAKLMVWLQVVFIATCASPTSQRVGIKTCFFSQALFVLSINQAVFYVTLQPGKWHFFVSCFPWKVDTPCNERHIHTQKISSTAHSHTKNLFILHDS